MCTVHCIWLQTYGKGPLRQREISSKGSFICIIPDRITHTTVFVTPVVEHWLERDMKKGALIKSVIFQDMRAHWCGHGLSNLLLWIQIIPANTTSIISR